VEIARDRYLDDTSKFHYTLTLTSRTIQAHSLLTSLSPEEHAALGDMLVRCLDEVQALLRTKLPQPAGVG
jgi:hypothetical protein